MQEKRKKATTTKSVLDTFPGFTSAFHFSVRGAEMGSAVSGGPALELPPAGSHGQTSLVAVAALGYGVIVTLFCVLVCRHGPQGLPRKQN